MAETNYLLALNTTSGKTQDQLSQALYAYAYGLVIKMVCGGKVAEKLLTVFKDQLPPAMKFNATRVNAADHLKQKLLENKQDELAAQMGNALAMKLLLGSFTFGDKTLEQINGVFRNNNLPPINIDTAADTNAIVISEHTQGQGHHALMLTESDRILLESTIRMHQNAQFQKEMLTRSNTKPMISLTIFAAMLLVAASIFTFGMGGVIIIGGLMSYLFGASLGAAVASAGYYINGVMSNGTKSNAVYDTAWVIPNLQEPIMVDDAAKPNTSALQTVYGPVVGADSAEVASADRAASAAAASAPASNGI